MPSFLMYYIHMDYVLQFSDYQIRSEEVPGEISLLVYLASCPFRCKNCHTPWLWEQSGDYLQKILVNLLVIYKNRITCVCFMGEGLGSKKERDELKYWCRIIKSYKLKSAIYSGRDGYPRKWMNCFDYTKMGRYIQEFGPLTSKTTNQRLFKNTLGSWSDITEKFWLEYR